MSKGSVIQMYDKARRLLEDKTAIVPHSGTANARNLFQQVLDVFPK